MVAALINIYTSVAGFLKDIEPNTYNNLMIKYATYCDGDVVKAIKTGPKPKPIRSITLDLSDID
jgi:hypothetical protein